MKGFIELHHNNSVQTFYFPVDKIGVAVDSRGASILFEGDEYYVDESIEEISAKIESTKGEVTTGGNIVFNAITSENPTPRQNIYYRTADRRPTKVDADAIGLVFVSDNLIDWSQSYKPKNWKFWAPVPKVEVKE